MKIKNVIQHPLIPGFYLGEVGPFKFEAQINLYKYAIVGRKSIRIESIDGSPNIRLLAIKGICVIGADKILPNILPKTKEGKEAFNSIVKYFKELSKKGK